MRVLIVGRLFGLGGAEQSLLPLARHLAAAGYMLTLLLLRSPDSTTVFADFPGEVIQASGSSLGQRIRGFWQLSRAISQADLVIVTSELTPTYVTWLLSAWYRRPLVADVQVCLSQWIKDSCNPVHHSLCRWVYPRIQQIRCVSKGVAKDLQETYGVSAKQLSVIYVPFDLEAIAHASRHSIPAIHEPIFERPTIVAAGRFTNQKRFDVAIEAFFRLRQQYLKDARLLILGEGELRTQLEEQVAKLGLGQSAFLPGHVKNPHAYIRRSQVFLLSSDYEGFGRVLVDALAVGCPVVSTDCPFGPGEILEAGKWGILTPTGDVTAIAAALNQVLNDPALAEHLCQQGVLRAKAFDTHEIVHQYQTLIDETVSHY